jgi:hypothetical protein
MKLSLIGECAALLLGGATTIVPVESPDVVTIPLDAIWAYNMPDTVDIHSLDDNGEAAKVVAEIRRRLVTATPNWKEAKAAFAVAATELKALREAHAVLVEGKKPRQTFPADSDISIIFFSYQFGQYVHLEKVTRRGNVIDVQYKFVPHKTKEVTEHFALIPLGKLAPGKAHVEITQSPMEPKWINAGWKDVDRDVARRIVCRPFSFVVGEDVK